MANLFSKLLNKRNAIVVVLLWGRKVAEKCIIALKTVTNFQLLCPSHFLQVGHSTSKLRYDHVQPKATML